MFHIDKQEFGTFVAMLRKEKLKLYFSREFCGI